MSSPEEEGRGRGGERMGGVAWRWGEMAARGPMWGGGGVMREAGRGQATAGAQLGKDHVRRRPGAAQLRPRWHVGLFAQFGGRRSRPTSPGRQALFRQPSGLGAKYVHTYSTNKWVWHTPASGSSFQRSALTAGVHTGTAVPQERRISPPSSPPARGRGPWAARAAAAAGEDPRQVLAP